MKFIAHSKLNLYFHIAGRRDDGYHLIESIFAFTEFGDEIVIKSDEQLTLSIDGEFASVIAHESIENNLVYRAAELLQKICNVSEGAQIHLTKNIPVGAGLGGGSSDAAAILKALNSFWNLNLSFEKLCEIGLQLGADVPACIIEKPAFVRGIGEIIEPVTLPFTRKFVVLVNSNKLLPTPQVFAQYKKRNPAFDISVNHDRFNITAHHNALETDAIVLMPEIQTILEAMQKQEGCFLSRMSGSGATCFGLFDDLNDAKNACSFFEKMFSEYWMCLTALARTSNV